jgi:hypothetical protein
MNLILSFFIEAGILLTFNGSGGSIEGMALPSGVTEVDYAGNGRPARRWDVNPSLIGGSLAETAGIPASQSS